MKDQNPIEKMLSKKSPEMDPLFRKKLRDRLVDLAEKNLGEKPSLIHSFILNMKRNSFVYVAALVLMIFSISLVLPKEITAPEVLAQVAENYQRNGDIYHEKMVHSRYESGQLIESSMDEIYYDEVGNHLSLVKNPDTEEILSVYLSTVDQYGDSDVYETPFMDKMVEQGSDQDAWYEVFRGEKIHCVEEVGEDPEVRSLSVLSLAAEDYSVYQVTGESVNLNEFEEGMTLWDLMNQRGGSAESYIRELIDSESYEYEVLEEEGVKYHVFKKALAPYDEQEGEGGRVLWFYIDAETYRLVRYDLHFKFDPNRLEQSLILESGYLQSNENLDVFDPSQYGELQSSFMLSASLPFVPDSDGCYDWQGKALDPLILDELPEVALEDWRALSVGMLERSQSPGPFDMGDESEDVRLPIDLTMDPVLPSKGSITQGYHAGHSGWDFSGEENDPVYAPLDAVVLEVMEGPEGRSNDGYGNSVLLSHTVDGVEFQTFYAHLNEIEVEVGQTIKQGVIIAAMGRTGKVTMDPDGGGGVLHFELRFTDHKLSPHQLFE